MVFHSAVIDRIEQLLSNVGNTINTISGVIQRTVSNIVDNIGTFIFDTATTISNAIVNVFSDVANTISNTMSGIVNSITNYISEAASTIGSIVDSVVDSIAGFVSTATSTLNNIFDSVVQEIATSFQTASDFLFDIVQTVKTSLEVLFNDVKLFASDLFQSIRDGVATIINSAGEVVESITTAIRDFISSVVDVVGGALRDLLDTISDLPGEIADLADQLIESAKENIAQPIINLPEMLIKQITEAISGEPVKESEAMNLNALKMVFGSSPVVRTPQEMRELVESFIPSNPTMKLIVNSILSPFIVLASLGGIVQANSQIVLQEHALENPYRIMEPADVIRALHFNLISDDIAIKELRKTGYTESDSEILTQIGDFIVPAGELSSWLLRDLISDDEFVETLKRTGWRDNDISNLRKANFFIPPVQDLITMAVREVFTPEIAEGFGQFEDFPPEFVVQAKKQGVSEEWAKRYWGAHWKLPSVQMGFQMLHRDIISEEELSLLMRASDIMPFWRDKLIQLSFSPLTRVDVRRMHRVGVLSAEEVTRAYKDIGYSELNAQRLTDFTVKLNEGGGSEEERGLGDLTTSNIIGFYKDGLFTSEEATNILIQSGLTPDAANIYISNAGMEIARDERKEASDLVILQANSGVITFEQAQDVLSELGLTELEKARALKKIETERAKRNKIPSKADLGKMITAQIITEDEYLETMRLIGYSELWASRYLQLIGVGANA